jgi:hypothetical protein
MDLTDSIENEHFCLRLLAGFGLPVARTEIADFAGRARWSSNASTGCAPATAA